MIDNEPQNKMEVCAYYVRFATPTVGPVKLPDFSYCVTEIGFSTLVYVATVHSQRGVDDVMRRIKECWPDSEAQKVVTRLSDFEASEFQPRAYTYGQVVEHRRLSLFKRFTSTKHRI